MCVHVRLCVCVLCVKITRWDYVPGKDYINKAEMLLCKKKTFWALNKVTENAFPTCLYVQWYPDNRLTGYQSIQIHDSITGCFNNRPKWPDIKALLR